MKPRLGICLLFSFLLFALLSQAENTSAQSSTGITTLVSRHTNGTQGNGDSGKASASADGRYVAFHSAATNLVDNDTNGATDVFVYDRLTGQTTLVSRHTNGSPGGGGSPSISDDGRYVAFSSGIALVDDDTNGWGDVYVHDRNTGQTTRISRHSDDTQGNNNSNQASISADGQIVVFLSAATNLVAVDGNGVIDVFAHDRGTGQTTLVSRHTNGTQANADSLTPVISADGRIVAFSSLANTLTDNESGNVFDIFVHDRLTGETMLGSRSSATPDRGSDFEPSLSADGRYLAFQSDADNLLGPPTNDFTQRVYVRDRQTDQTTLVAINTDGVPLSLLSKSPSISADGRFVAFVYTHFFGSGSDFQVYVRDRELGRTRKVSVSSGQTDGNDNSINPAISDNGRYIAYTSEATDLIANDTNGFDDVFLHERPYAISGTVRDENGVPLASVTIKLNNSFSNFTSTDANGNYTLHNVPPGQHTVWPSADDYVLTPASTPVTTPPDASGIDFTGVFAPRQVFAPTADAYVAQGAPTSNFGSEDFLGVRDNASADLTTYLKFDISGLDPCGEILSAGIDLLVDTSGPNGGDLYSVGNNWTESGITWNNAPAVSGTPLDNAGQVGAFNYISLDVGSAVPGNGVYSFALKGGTSNAVFYTSREFGDSDAPILWVRQRAGAPGVPTAAFTGSPLSGQAPLAVSFTNQSSGCPTSWAWNFGGGGTSTQQNPSHTYNNPGTYTVSLTVSNSQGNDTETKTAYITVTEPPPPPAGDTLYVSPATAGTVGGVAATPQDILIHDTGANTWALHFDGSDVGVTKILSGFTHLADGSLLLSFKANQPLTGLGTVTPWDVVRFVPTSTGNNTTGSFQWYIDGSDVGLSAAAEKIDALEVLANGRVLVSTTGNSAVPKQGGGTLKSQDEDLIAFIPTTLGVNTVGTWALHFNGTAITGLGAEDVVGAHVDEATGDLYLAILGAFNVGGVSGNGKDILRLQPTGGGNYTVTRYWRGGDHGFNLNLGGIEISN